MRHFLIGLVLGSVLTTGLGLAQVRSFDGLNQQQRYGQRSIDLMQQQNRILQQRNFQEQMNRGLRQPC